MQLLEKGCNARKILTRGIGVNVANGSRNAQRFAAFDQRVEHPRGEMFPDVGGRSDACGVARIGAAGAQRSDHRLF